jgi:hypothetical protein
MKLRDVDAVLAESQRERNWTNQNREELNSKSDGRERSNEQRR